MAAARPNGSSRRVRPPPTPRWASGRELSLLEDRALAFRAVQLAGARFLRILPAAVDANVLLNTMIRAEKGERADLFPAAERGLIRLYVGETVPVDVEDHIAARARRAKVDPADLERRWENVRPLLRVVDTEGLGHPRLQRIEERDLDDRSTAVLSLFVGARLTWSSDCDLRNEGYAEWLNLEIVAAAQKVGEFDLSAHFALNLSTETVSAAGRAVMRALERPGVERTAALIVLAAAAGVLTVAYLRDPERVKQTAAAIAREGVAALRALSAYRDEHGQALPAVPAPSVSEPLAFQVAHALAVAPAPLTVVEIAEVLTSTGAPTEPPVVEEALRGHRMFVRGKHGWQLGSW